MAKAYIPLYRKYRPQKFSDLVGQESVAKTLSNAIELDRVAHAYLFTGSRGTGKTSTARILAKSLNCAEGPTVDPCGKCPSCIDIANSNSIDVIEIDAASNGSVESARNLIDKVQFMPVAGKYKVYIIDEVHMLSTQAFNALLKTLEEPPKNLVFILATTESHKVLNTIISRCQRFDFRRVNQDLISQKLREIAENENIKINDKALSVIARRSHGGMRDALGLLDQASVLSSLKNEITESDIISLIGSMPEDILFKIAESIADRDPNTLITLINHIISVNEPVMVIRELINYFRNLLFVRNTDDLDKIKDLIDFSDNILGDIKSQSAKFETSEIVQIIEKLFECEKTLKYSSQQRLWLEVGLIGICHRHDIQVIKELEARIIKLEEAVSSGNIPAVKVAGVSIKPVEIVKPEKVVKSEPNSVSTDVPVSMNSFQSLPDEITTIQSEEADTEKMLNLIQYDKKECLAPVEQVQNGGTIINLADNWKKLLENIESMPARMFFTNLSSPVEINSEKIIITFKTEALVKQAKDDKTKTLPLEKSATKIFGDLPKILIRTPLAEDNSAQKKNDELKSIAPQQKIQQISSPIMEEIPDIPTRGNQVAVSENPVSSEEREIAEEIEEIEAKIIPVNLSEQAKLVLDLFSGKIIDS